MFGWPPLGRLAHWWIVRCPALPSLRSDQSTGASGVGRVPELFVLVHSIDGPHLRNAEAQALLSQLAEIPAVHVIATTDHVLAPLREFH